MARLFSANAGIVLYAAIIRLSALPGTTAIPQERRNPTPPTKGGPRRVPDCFAKTERELPSPHVLHYNIIFLAESPPLLTVPATGISEAATAARCRPRMHSRDTLVTRSFVPCRDGHQSFPFAPTGFGRSRPSSPDTQCWLGSWQCEDGSRRQPRGVGSHGVNRTFQAGDEGPCNRRQPAFHPPEDPGAAPAAACTR